MRDDAAEKLDCTEARACPGNLGGADFGSVLGDNTKDDCGRSLLLIDDRFFPNKKLIREAALFAWCLVVQLLLLLLLLLLATPGL